MRFPHRKICFCTGFRTHQTDCRLSLSFVIKGFNRDTSYLSIPCEFILRSGDELTALDFKKMYEIAIANEEDGRHSPFRDIRISDEQHQNIVRRCIDYLRSADGDGIERKIVISRCNTFDMAYPELTALLRRLLDTRPDALIFFFSTPQTGTWLGASPELLLSTRGKKVCSMSLAGTRPSGCSDNSYHGSDTTDSDSWDFKNIQEQRIVTDEITRTLNKFGLKTLTDGPATVCAGNVEHLCTRIFSTSNEVMTSEEILDIASALSPTPALCGYPRDEAEDFILSNELHERELYGGFMGLTDSSGGWADLYVNLRSGRYNPVTGRFCAFAGGGITPFSDAVAEVMETTRKLQWCSPSQR